MRGLTGPCPADTVFFGGGTPSLMEPATVGAVLDAVDRLWGIAPGAEVTLEANPTSVEAGRFRGYAAAGVNRVSLGVQALDDADLRALGRQHSGRRGLRRLRCRPGAVRPRQLRPDLCPDRPDRRRLGGRADARPRDGPRPPLALPADDRARHALCRAARPRAPARPARRRRGGDVRGHARADRGRRHAGLRGLEPCAPGRRGPAQPRLLAGRRLCRHRPRRAWPDHRPGRPAPRRRDAARPRRLARPGGRCRPRARPRRARRPAGSGDRVPADGAAPRRGRRSRPPCPAGRGAHRAGPHRPAGRLRPSPPRRSLGSPRRRRGASC